VHVSARAGGELVSVRFAKRIHPCVAMLFADAAVDIAMPAIKPRSTCSVAHSLVLLSCLEKLDTVPNGGAATAKIDRDVPVAVIRDRDSRRQPIVMTAVVVVRSAPTIAVEVGVVHEEHVTAVATVDTTTSPRVRNSRSCRNCMRQSFLHCPAQKGPVTAGAGRIPPVSASLMMPLDTFAADSGNKRIGGRFFILSPQSPLSPGLWECICPSGAIRPPV
jgi:hypothetical protein